MMLFTAGAVKYVRIRKAINVISNLARMLFVALKRNLTDLICNITSNAFTEHYFRHYFNKYLYITQHIT